MSHRIRIGANFRSYADFKASFDDYCLMNAIAGVPLTFVRHTNKKLSVNTFKNDPLDQDTIHRFVYNNLSLKCIHHETITTNENGPHCSGRITLLYNRSKNMLSITSFCRHSNHPVVNVIQDENANENCRLSEILKIVRQLPDDALALLKQVCTGIHENWDDENTAGLTVKIVPIKNESDVIAQIEHELQTFDPGNNTIFLCNDCFFFKKKL